MNALSRIGWTFELIASYLSTGPFRYYVRCPMATFCKVPKATIKCLEFYKRSEISQLTTLMGPTWVLSAPDGPPVGPMNLAIRVAMHFEPSAEAMCAFKFILVCFNLITWVRDLKARTIHFKMPDIETDPV